MADHDEELDLFDIRMEFFNLLKKLSATEASRSKVVRFGLKYKQCYDDLYGLLIEDLEKSSASHRLNIFNSISELVQQSVRDRFDGYRKLTEKDLQKIIELVCPHDQMGNTNVPYVRSILHSLKSHKIFTEQLISKVETPLTARDSRFSSYRKEPSSYSKETIIRRMEEDRERHKRTREEIWIRPASEQLDVQFDLLWDVTAPWDEEDTNNAKEEMEKWRREKLSVSEGR
ncbi:CTD kinase subunit gamma CTK3-domain-containing protein [Paraphysoderma sedebokerense]|nr:CTD kinase subunit gamma CTK3-domain-containing protein [Paraphysoderma sedebokerense]KAI9138316.1 CTD kinase subunit gamma CTK3-domain-containing protein [Paraphysoderma sedebokerense]